MRVGGRPAKQGNASSKGAPLEGGGALDECMAATASLACCKSLLHAVGVPQMPPSAARVRRAAADPAALRRAPAAPGRTTPRWARPAARHAPMCSPPAHNQSSLRVWFRFRGGGGQVGSGPWRSGRVGSEACKHAMLLLLLMMRAAEEGRVYVHATWRGMGAAVSRGRFRPAAAHLLPVPGPTPAQSAA